MSTPSLRAARPVVPLALRRLLRLLLSQIHLVLRRRLLVGTGRQQD